MPTSSQALEANLLAVEGMVRELNAVQPFIMPLEYDRLDRLKFLMLRLVRLEQKSNMYDMLVTLAVLKPLTSTLVSFLQL